MLLTDGKTGCNQERSELFTTLGLLTKKFGEQYGMIGEAEPPTRAKHSGNLLKTFLLVRPMMKRQAAECHIDGLIRKRKRLSGSDLENSVGSKPLGYSNHLRRRIDAP